ncbi:MAG TPA: biosynthetic peptidoglycan transglycosylase, partial [Solimonas sp.]
MKLLKATAVAFALLVLATLVSQRALPGTLRPVDESTAQVDVLDRDGRPLQISYDGGWNLHGQMALAKIPQTLRTAFVESEDRRFWQHHGIDWRARFAALWTDLRAGRAVRGASTISEQVVRILRPRPRTVWSRWVEGFEAMRLEARFSKADILEFYLNQVPYGANRRGVGPAASHYFGRSLDTLSREEMLALAVMVRAPSRLARDPQALQSRVRRLAAAMQAR